VASKNRKRILLLAWISIAGLLIALAVWFSRSFYLPRQTAPESYARVLRDERAAGWRFADHFPDTISAAATGVHFFFQPAALQGPTQLELRCTLPREQITSIERQFATKATTRTTASDWPQFRQIPQGFEKYILGVQEGNKGFDYGVAIDSKTSEVIYWAEEW